MNTTNHTLSSLYPHKPLRLRTSGHPLTYVKRGVTRSGKIIYVGNPKRLDRHRAHAEEQLSTGHEQPQVVSVGQTPGPVSAAARVARIPLQVANVVAIWITREGGVDVTDERKTVKVEYKPVIADV